MKKLIIKLALVTFTVFVLDYAIGKTLRFFYFKETSGSHYLTTNALENTRAEIVVFGSSRANHHYVPKIFEDSLKMTYYNTGKDGLGIFYQLAVLKSILKRYTPKLIILDYSGGFDKKVDSYDKLNTLLPYYKTHKEIDKIIELKSPFEKVKLISEIYPFNSMISTIVVRSLTLNKEKDPDIQGYIALQGKWNKKMDFNTYVPYEVDTNKLNSYREFITTAKKTSAKVIVIISPIFQDFDKYQEIEICKNICTLENIPFWDYSRHTSFHDKSYLFDDVSHLNNDGAIIFSKLVSNKIKCELHIP